MSKRPKITTDASPLSSNPFAALGQQLPDAPPGPVSDAPGPTAAAPPAVAAPAPIGRLIVRRLKRGQGGKTVTCIEGLPGSRIEDLQPRLKQELGCRARLDGATLVAGTGDHHRVADWLRAAGAREVVLGN
jgi:translation initiation factor 1